MKYPVAREIRYCLCGCGFSKIVRIKEIWNYKKGHNWKHHPTFLGEKRIIEDINKIKEGCKIRNLNPDYIQKLREFKRLHWKNSSYRLLMKEKTTGRKRSIESRLKMSLSKKGKPLSIEHRQKILKAVCSPNKKELFLARCLQDWLPNEYKFVGDGQLILGDKCPDFVNIKKGKKLIEFFGDFWHKEDDSLVRINHFKLFGYETLIIWERELFNIEKIKDKVLSFNKIK